MSSILERINQLSNQFSSLFEIEGLGEPSGDVPPSTNKVKKDVKTKDGKVELVSVEDELFPKDGNKREQFRQKVIDTINGMIQGTATLEDLLQVVRQKQVKTVKEGFEGAIEVLEQLLEEEEIKKERKNNKQHVYKRMDDPEKGRIGIQKKYSKVIHNDSKSKDPFFDYVKIGGVKYRVDSHGQIGEPLREGFEGVIEVLEELINETSDKKVECALNKANDKVVDGLFSFTGIDMNDVKKARKLEELANRRAKRQGKKIVVDFETGEHRHVKEEYEMVSKAIEESVKILELFDRPDLLKDIDNMLGSPVQKLIRKGLSSLSSKEKEKNKKNKK